MFLNKNIKYRDILIFALIGVIGYKIIDNYEVIFDFIDFMLSLISPFIYAFIFGYALNPVMVFLQKKLKMNKNIAILLTYLVITGLLVIGIMYVIPTIVDSIVSISSDIPKYMDKVQGWINDLMNNGKLSNLINDIGLQSYVSGISDKIGEVLLDILQGFGLSLVSITTNIIKVILGYIISIYVLVDKEKILAETRTITYMIFKDKMAGKLLEITRTLHKMIAVYIGTKAIDSLIIGLMAFVGLLIIDVPYAPLIAAIVGVTNMIPYFGPFIGEMVGFLFGIFISPIKAIIIFGFLFLLQQFDAWFLDPKLISHKVGVRPFVLIFAVLVGGGLFGIAGMLLASPVAATLNVFYERKLEKFKAQKLKEIENDE